MKSIRKYLKYTLILAIVFFFTSCSDFLTEEVYTEYEPDAFLQTEEGINSVLVASYRDLFVVNSQRNRMFVLNEFPGDIMWNWGGGFEAIAIIFMTYNWDSQSPELSKPWGEYYRSIRNANSFLDNIDNVAGLSSEKKKQFKAEARFIRAADYYYLWELFGPVPLITTASELNFEPAKASPEEFDTFIVSELQAAALELPLTQDLWGKATKGAALALLGKYYLNSKQWQKAADINKQVIDLDLYNLFQGDITNMFSVENEVNEEVVFTSPASPTFQGNDMMAHVFPPNYPIQNNWVNFGTQICLYNDWVQTYHPEDKRLGWMLFEYTDTRGNYQNLLNPGSTGKAVRCFKFVPDPNALGTQHGNDIPMIRYAEVLLNRAEALNELNGPDQESVSLLNQVRNRAGVPLYNVSDFASKDELRDAILDERGWEFVSEGQRRMDLIRHGQLISRAKERGASNAKDYMVRFPIPLEEIEANPNLKQNDGY